MELLNPLSSAFPAQSVAFTDTAGTTTGWNAGPQAVMVWSDSPCYIAVGEGVTATSADTPIPSFTPIPFKVPSTVSGVFKVSALRIDTNGTVYCKPINKE
jgi:hypothetical protein